MVIAYPKDPIILNSLDGGRRDRDASHEAALLKIYQRLRPGNPPQLEKARELFKEKFQDPNRYRLGRVGRFRINRKFDQDVPETEMTLAVVDFVNAIKYLLDLRAGKGHVDDIDHLGNRRLRTIDELAADELRKGFLKLRRTVQERMAIRDQQDMTPRTLINPKSVSAAIEYFFGRSELSQVVDQTNPLAQLTHERRLSALGPGGLNRKRAGFEVRDVHISHYGRICPIETPEGTNIGLISSLSIYAEVDEYGFLITPYRKVQQQEADRRRGEAAGRRGGAARARPGRHADRGRQDHRRPRQRPASAATSRSSRPSKVEYIDVSPKQMVGVSAGLIPFLEHDDANRALMGSNMQRQAVPLLITEPPLVVDRAGEGSRQALRHGRPGRGRRARRLRGRRADQDRGEGQDRPRVRAAQVPRPQRADLPQPEADRQDGPEGEEGRRSSPTGPPPTTANWRWAATCWSRSCPGRATTSRTRSSSASGWSRTTPTPRSTSRSSTSRSARRSSARKSSPATSRTSRPRRSRNLDEHGIVRIGTFVHPGDILVGKVSPKSQSELTPEEKLLHAIFGRAGEDVKNDSLEVPSGVEGIVIATHRFSRRASMTEDEKKALDKAGEGDRRRRTTEKIADQFREFVEALDEVLDKKELKDPQHRQAAGVATRTTRSVAEQAKTFKLDNLDIRSPENQKKANKIHHRHWERIQFFIDEQERKLNSLKRGDELPSGVQQMVKVYVATKRVISVGDKMAGRHGNKGVISKVLPEEDMPFLADGTPVDILLNPLGVPSRMNVGQILETHLGYAAAKLGFKAVTPVFDGATEEEIRGVPQGSRASPRPARACCTTAAPASASSSRSRSATSTCSSCTTWSTTRCTPGRRGRTRSSRSSRWAARPGSAASGSARWKCGRWKPTAPRTSCRSCSRSSRTTWRAARRSTSPWSRARTRWKPARRPASTCSPTRSAAWG